MTHEELTELMGIEPKPTKAKLVKELLNDISLFKTNLKLMLTLCDDMSLRAAEAFDSYEADAQDSLAEASAYQSMLDERDEQIRELSESLARLEKMESIHEPRN